MKWIGRSEEKSDPQGVRSERKNRQVEELINSRRSNLLACPGSGIALLFAFSRRLGDYFYVHVAMEDGTTESLHRFENLSWSWPVQAEAPGHHHSLYSRLTMKCLPTSLHSNVTP